MLAKEGSLNSRAVWNEGILLVLHGSAMDPRFALSLYMSGPVLSRCTVVGTATSVSTIAAAKSG